MSWNHRVVRRELPAAEAGAADATHEYSIREAYYGLGGDPQSVSWTANPIAPYGESLEGLRWVLEKMLEALDKPILDEQASTHPSCPNCKTNRYVHTNDPDPDLMCFACSTPVQAAQ